MAQIKKTLPGLIFCIAISIPTWILGKLFPVIGGPVFGILIGMLIVMIFPRIQMENLNFKERKSESAELKLEDGVKYTSKIILQYSIILLGFEMNLFNVIKVGGQSLFVLLFTLVAAFLTAFIMGKVLKLDGKMTTLIGVGTSICGGSAIAATAPVINAKDEDVAHAISTIFLFNIIAVFIFPALGHVFGMSDTGFGMWAGTAINDTSSVLAAGTVWSNDVGNNTALAFATIVKLTRTLMIVPIALVLAVYTTHNAQKNQNQTDGIKFSFVKVFPWFIIGFVATAIINTFFGNPSISTGLVSIGKFMIVMAMVAIGLNTNLKKLITNGFKPIFLGVCCWFAVASVSFFIQTLLKLM